MAKYYKWEWRDIDTGITYHAGWLDDTVLGEPLVYVGASLLGRLLFRDEDRAKNFPLALDTLRHAYILFTASKEVDLLAIHRERITDWMTSKLMLS